MLVTQKPRRRFWTAAHGQAMVELALTLPILTFGLVGGADLARAFALQIAVENGSRAGAEAYAITAANVRTLAQAQVAAIEEINRTPTAAATTSMVEVTLTRADGVVVASCTSTIAAPCFVNVRVQYGWRTLIDWPLIPNSGTFDRTTTMRTFF